MDLYAGRLDVGSERVQQEYAHRFRGASARDIGFALCGLYTVYACHFQSLRSHCAAATCRRCGFKFGIAGFWFHYSSPHLVYGLCWLFGGVCLRHCGFIEWSSRCGLGAVVAALGQCGLGHLNYRYCPGQLVGILRTRLGWLVGLGSGGESASDYLAVWYRTDSFAGGDREKRHLQELDGIAGYPGFCKQSAGHVYYPFRVADLGACLRQ